MVPSLVPSVVWLDRNQQSAELAVKMPETWWQKGDIGRLCYNTPHSMLVASMTHRTAPVRVRFFSVARWTFGTLIWVGRLVKPDISPARFLPLIQAWVRWTPSTIGIQGPLDMGDKDPSETAPNQ